MSNVSGNTTRQQILALGGLGWHRIADADRPRRTPPKTVALLEAAMGSTRAQMSAAQLAHERQTDLRTDQMEK